MGFPAEKYSFVQKMRLHREKMPFPAEKYTFLQKNAVFGMAHGRKPQEGFRAQESRALANFHKIQSAPAELPK